MFLVRISAATAFITVLGADIGTSIAALIESQKIIAISPLFLRGSLSADYNDHNSVIVSSSEAINLKNRFKNVKIVWLGVCLVINFLVVYYVR